MRSTDLAAFNLAPCLQLTPGCNHSNPVVLRHVAKAHAAGITVCWEYNWSFDLSVRISNQFFMNEEIQLC